MTAGLLNRVRPGLLAPSTTLPSLPGKGREIQGRKADGVEGPRSGSSFGWRPALDQALRPWTGGCHVGRTTWAIPYLRALVSTNPKMVTWVLQVVCRRKSSTPWAEQGQSELASESGLRTHRCIWGLPRSFH